MEPITRGKGVTQSERYLAALADGTFLNLWSYPNAHRAPGKELCDLLVVCGDDVLVFSDKSIEWKDRTETQTAWQRWYRDAIAKSVAQVRGAERWLNEHPDRVFLDAGCTQPLPFQLPPPERRQFHGIIVALGAEAATRRFAHNEYGSFAIFPALEGSAHAEPRAAGAEYFAFGDLNPDGSFIHVFDRVGLDVTMRELDTISDFTRYLSHRAAFIRSKRLIHAPSEPDLLTSFMANIGRDGEHCFPASKGNNQIAIGDRQYAQFQRSLPYKRRVAADEVSYVWDTLITRFTDPTLAGTMVEIEGAALPADEIEPVLRLMARENRTQRRLIGAAVRDALQKAEETKAPKYARTMLPGIHTANPDLVYCVLVLACPNSDRPKVDYERYREVRREMLKTYCLANLKENRDLRHAIGIGLDAAPSVTGLKGSSEDLVYICPAEWTPRLEAQVDEAKERYNILQQPQRNFSVMAVDEFPVSGAEGIQVDKLNRQQRRAWERARAKARGRRR